ncbi:MAG: ribosome small subunit-dependent GTPase A [Alloprevotella sp.]|nr:ribosome small subunit-dependent GTPase A [Alloprevotella sp.]
MKGLVVRSTGSWYDVLTDDGRRLTCKVKGNFRLRGIRSTNPVAVGDRVEVGNPESATDEAAFITEVFDRRNHIVRKASNLSKQSHILAANIDLALLIVTVARPETSTTFIDRFLACAEAYRVPALIAFNKTDELTEAEREAQDYLATLYGDIGYETLSISALRGTGLAELRARLAGRTTLLAGNSGVGKSTLLNALIPEANARTADISEAHQTGMHTTTYSELYPLPEGGGLIDIPGIKGFGTFDIEPEEVAHYFRDIFRISRDCRFHNCTHTHEPECAVVRALEEHRLAPSRYQSYLSMMQDKDGGKYRAAY